MGEFDRVFRGRRVLVTGDTGFKGSWLALRLQTLGAEVHGLALPAEDPKSLFRLARVDRLVEHRDLDIRDHSALLKAWRRIRPEFVFHLAAQALVRRSYREPRENFESNVQGSVNVLECARLVPGTKALVYVTSDKCYENPETGRPCKETDRLGGRDPYSASKAAAELVFASYRASFLGGIGAASARAGNVIGGGDRSEDRLIPDAVRAAESRRGLTLRYPEATRPWQHVLDPLRGYLSLAAGLAKDPARFSGAWNFGPAGRASRSVADLVGAFVRELGAPVPVKVERSRLHEAGKLALDSGKARRELGWAPLWGFDRLVRETAAWHRRVAAGEDARAVTLEQIAAHAAEAKS